MHSVVQAYENITQKERHKCSLAFELYFISEHTLK